MDNIPSSFIGYKKQTVDDIISKKNNLLETQKKDINYLRNEINRLETQIKESKKQVENSEENTK